MSEEATPDTDLSEHIVAAVLDLAGVIRLEPSMKGLLRRAGSLRPPGRASSTLGADGVSVSTFGTITDVVVDAAADTSRPALTTAREVRSAVHHSLREHHLEPGRVEVNILTVEYEGQ